MLMSSKLLQLECSDYLGSIIQTVCQGEVGVMGFCVDVTLGANECRQPPIHLCL